MKNFEEIMKTKPVYLNDWKCKEDLERDFQCDLSDVNILFASYTYEDYSGDAWVLYEKDGKLYEVNGSHCSCYGLEEQWSDSEEVLLEVLHHRFKKGTYGAGEYKTEIQEFLGMY